MKADSQRIAIAEACGWTKIAEWVGLRGPHGHKPGLPFGCLSKVPDFLNDLNAMAEAEKTIDPHDRNTYIVKLWHVCGFEAKSVSFWTEYNYRALYAMAHATAAQRAEAFLRTLNLWKP